MSPATWETQYRRIRTLPHTHYHVSPARMHPKGVTRGWVPALVGRAARETGPVTTVSLKSRRVASAAVTQNGRRPARRAKNGP